MVFQSRVYSVLVVSASQKFNDALTRLIPETLYSPVTVVSSVAAARRKLLKLRFKLQLLECVYLLGHMYMIAVRNVALIRDTRYDAKPFL